MPSEDEAFSESVFDLDEKIQSFLEIFFKDEEEVLQFNINFLENNGFLYHDKIDYMRLTRFISSAFRTIQTADSFAVGALEQKFYKDLAFLGNFYKQFRAKKKDSAAVFKYQFLPYAGGLEALARVVQESLEEEGAEAAFASYLKLQFEHEFARMHESLDYELRLVINTKMHYFDRLLWTEAKKSPAVIDFFRRINAKETSGEVELSTKIFIAQYLKTIDINHSKDGAWHDYLKKVIPIME